MALSSEWGYATVAITDPPTAASSEWGVATAALPRPHHPVGILTDAGMKYMPLLVWDGIALR